MILVIGTTGFIASHLIGELLSKDKNIMIGVDNLYSGTSANIEHIKFCDKNNKFRFIEENIRNFEEINKIVKKYAIKQICHLASVLSVQELIENPIPSHAVNGKDTLNILEVGRLNKVKKVVFSSSVAVYGDELKQPKNENFIVKPISLYGFDKFIGEQYMQIIKR